MSNLWAKRSFIKIVSLYVIHNGNLFVVHNPFLLHEQSWGNNFAKNQFRFRKYVNQYKLSVQPISSCGEQRFLFSVIQKTETKQIFFSINESLRLASHEHHSIEYWEITMSLGFFFFIEIRKYILKDPKTTNLHSELPDCINEPVIYIGTKRFEPRVSIINLLLPYSYVVINRKGPFTPSASEQLLLTLQLDKHF